MPQLANTCNLALKSTATLLKSFSLLFFIFSPSTSHLSCNKVCKAVQVLSGSWAMFPVVLFPNCAAAPQDL